MRRARWTIAVFLIAGCQPGPTPDPASSVKSDPNLPAPAAFASWPKVTNKPVEVGPALWALCREPSPEEDRRREEQSAPHGPHAGSIVVRVSPEAIDPFRAGKTLPVGSSVIKEKYKDGLETMDAYAVMVKREAGYDPAGGDWEYAYVTLAPERKVTRGRLTECSGCHASAKQGDYLFRSYGE